MTIEVQMKDLLEAGVHFGHQTRRWNPKMKPFIYGEKNGTHIINLQKTQMLLNQALKVVEDVVTKGGNVLFVATKKQAQSIVAEEAKKSQMFYVNHRWLGGMLTNWLTVKASISKLKKIEKMSQDGTYESITKREVVLKEKLRIKLERSLGGIKSMPSIPGIVFVIDAKKEHTGILEAKKLGIPVIAVTDTNSDPDDIDYIIPGNDDSIKSIKLYSSLIGAAALRGLQKRKLETPADESVPSKDGRSQIKVKRLKPNS